MSFTYKYPHMAVTVDVALFAATDPTRILLIQRRKDPFKACWALPGGFVDMDETAVHAAARELAEETGVTDVPLHFVSFFDAVGRDPRERTLSLAFYGVTPRKLRAQGGDDASAAKWHSIHALPPLAFDHAEIIRAALKKARRQLKSMTSPAQAPR